MRLNEAVEVSIVLGFDLRKVLLNPSDRERLLSALRESLKDQRERFDDIANCTASLLMQQSVAGTHLEQALEEGLDEWQDSERAVVEEVLDAVREYAPERAVVMGRAWDRERRGRPDEEVQELWDDWEVELETVQALRQARAVLQGEEHEDGEPFTGGRWMSLFHAVEALSLVLARESERAGEDLATNASPEVAVAQARRLWADRSGKGRDSGEHRDAG
ncbi:hypothetical protein [Ornithinimicrobium sp. CNJ-824]|uniref:hypothetical protein n=1 Tax=Ornithinimicrobium sp. CNJ-824 TaxID=1904966 RepID=UPI00117E0F7A|nr:hypothetical protein [Ornithinimicrobium sp. CNJ-824]